MKEHLLIKGKEPGLDNTRAAVEGWSARPVCHFTAEKSWINDPNGLLWYGGEYHLFYQLHPKDNTCGPMHWGHAVSEDLVRWRRLPVALYPDSIGTVFSGSAVVDWKNTAGFQIGEEKTLVAVFTHNKPDGQAQSLAYSNDRGRTWTKYAGNPVLERPEYRDFRDPKVFWHSARACWIMALAAGEKIQFYSSPDLIHWRFESEFGMGQGAHGEVWECPDLFELPVEGRPGSSRWLLAVSVAGRVQYFVGRFDGRSFLNENAAETVLWADEGMDFYAAASWNGIPETDGRRIWIGWLNNWAYARETPTSPWRGMLTLPRELRLRQTAQGIRLLQRPASELLALRKERICYETETRWSGENRFHGAAAYAWELILALTPEKPEGKFGIRLLRGKEVCASVEYDAATNQVAFCRMGNEAGIFHKEYPSRQTASIAPEDGMLRLHLFVDSCSAELFCGGGTPVFTNQLYPTASRTVPELFGQGGFRVRELELWSLKEQETAETRI